MAEKALAKREQSIVPLSPEMLIAKAIEAGTPVEALERLLAMRQTLKAEQAREAFIDAMAAFQAECPVIEKTKAADRYKYAPLDKIVAATSDLRAKYGFSYSFNTRFESDPPAQVTICTVRHREGHEESSEFRSPIDPENKARMNALQLSASSQTYSKRYAFINAFGIVTGDEDDDAQSLTRAREQAQADKREAQGQRREPSGPPPGEVRMPPRQQSSEGAARRLTPEELREVTCPHCGKTGTGIGLSSKPGKVACAKGKGGCGGEFDFEEPAEARQGELIP